MFIHRLPQLAFSAKLLCLLMVVICGAVPSMVRSVKLYSVSSSKFVRITDSGQVYGAEGSEADDNLNLTIASIDFTKLSIYSEQTGRYICFNKKWKLIGMPERRNPRSLERCQFHEEMDSRGYNTYQSIANGSYFLALNSRGKPARRHPKRGYDDEKFKNFVKKGEKGFDIASHNLKVSKGNSPDSALRYYPAQQPRHKTRHRHLKRRG